MKTKEFIEMLQKEDPSGESYIRVNGGAIVSCESKPGYWDGMYSYYDKENNTLHITAKGYKIDIITMDWEDVVWDHNGNMDEIRKILKPDFSAYVEKETKENNFWNKVEDESKYAKESHDKLMKEMLDRSLERFNNGWTLYKVKGKKQPFGYWKKGLRKQDAVVGEVIAVLRNLELFTEKEKSKFTQYKLKIKN